MDSWASSSRFPWQSNRCALTANCRRVRMRERVVIAAADPLNLVGIIVPGERIPAISGKKRYVPRWRVGSGGCAAAGF